MFELSQVWEVRENVLRIKHGTMTSKWGYLFDLKRSSFTSCCVSEIGNTQMGHRQQNNFIYCIPYAMQNWKKKVLVIHLKGLS